MCEARKKSLESRALIVGAGAGGLASALILQNAGIQCTLLEKNNCVGGKLSADVIDAYTFDNGPVTLTLPTILSELFRKTGRDLRDYLELVELDPQWQCLFSDGFRFDFRSGEEQMLEEIRSFDPREVDPFRLLCRKSAELYRLVQEKLFFRDYGSLVDMVFDQRPSLWDGIQMVQNAEALKTYSQLVEAHIKNPYLLQALGQLPQLVGSSPQWAPAHLAYLIHLQFEKGCWYPMGGMNKISVALAKRFEELGGRIELGKRVSHIYHDGVKIRGIETEDGSLWEAGEYVINADFNSFAPLLGEKPPSDDRVSCSALSISLGLKKKISALSHLNIFFPRSGKNELKSLFELGLPCDDPSIYVSVPTKTDSSVAPKDCECVNILVHCPALNGKTDWTTYADTYFDLIRTKLKNSGFDLNTHEVEVKIVRSPLDIQDRWKSYRGNLYGETSHGRMAGTFKQRNQSRFRNLQFAGRCVNPGAGLPLSLMSGMTASSNILSRRATWTDLHL